MNIHFSLRAVAGLLLASLVSPVVAAPVVIFDHDVRALSTAAFPNSVAARNDFLSQVATLGGTAAHQNFTSGVANGANPSFGFSGSTITATTADFTLGFVPFFGVNDTHNGSATTALIETEIASGVPTVETANSIEFSGPINAFGLFVCQVGDVLAHSVTFRIEKTGDPTSVRDIVIPVGPDWGGAAMAYLGIIDTEFRFNRVTMIESTNVNGNNTSDDLEDGIMWDNLSIAVTPVPEPGTWVLLAIGGALTLGMGRRRARAARRA